MQNFDIDLELMKWKYRAHSLQLSNWVFPLEHRDDALDWVLMS